MKITNFLVLNGAGEKIKADAHGNNVAFDCFDCLHPVLAISMNNQRGNDDAHPTYCKGCNAGYFLDVRESHEKLYIHRTNA